MPTYVYECAKCGEEMEEWQSFSEEPLKKHAGCGGKLSKVLQPVGIVFKGSGFHRTDSRSSAKRHSNGSSDAKDSNDSNDSNDSKDSKDSSKSSSTSDKSESKSESSSKSTSDTKKSSPSPSK